MDRHIDFEGIENFRDFGGYATVCGRGVRRGLLYRSASHHQATEADLERLRTLGVAAIVDLRHADERLREPSRRWRRFDARVIENDIASDHPDWADTLSGIGAPTPAWFHQDSLNYYLRAPFEARHLDLFRRYLHALAERPGPIVVHCAAGKDRTGLICALTHHIAGVHGDDILADYLLTNDEARMERKMVFLRGWLETTLRVKASDAALRVAVSVHPEYLEAAFAAIREAYGSIDGYLADALGVDDRLRERVRESLLA